MSVSLTLNASDMKTDDSIVKIAIKKDIDSQLYNLNYSYSAQT